MVTCPACEGSIDVDEEDVDEGDSISCDECGADLRVVRRGDDTASAVEGAQIIVTATRAAVPLFEGARVSSGTFVAAVGSSRPDTRELDDALMARAGGIIVEWKPQTLREAGDLVLLAPGIRDRLSIVDLGDVVADKVPPRKSERDIVIFKSVGVGLEDVVVAGLAYRRLTGTDG